MLRKILRKSQPNFKHHVKKIEAQVKKCFFYKKKRVDVYLLLNFLLCLHNQLSSMHSIVTLAVGYTKSFFKNVFKVISN